jgi:hypothetical protein
VNRESLFEACYKRDNRHTTGGKRTQQTPT